MAVSTWTNKIRVSVCVCVCVMLAFRESRFECGGLNVASYVCMYVCVCACVCVMLGEPL